MSRSFSNRRKIERRKIGPGFDPGNCPQCKAKYVFYDLGMLSIPGVSNGGYVVYQCPKLHSTVAYIGRYDEYMRFFADEVSK